MSIVDNIRIKQDFMEDGYVFEKGLEDKARAGVTSRWAPGVEWAPGGPTGVTCYLCGNTSPNNPCSSCVSKARSRQAGGGLGATIMRDLSKPAGDDDDALPDDPAAGTCGLHFLDGEYNDPPPTLRGIMAGYLHLTDLEPEDVDLTGMDDKVINGYVTYTHIPLKD